MAKTYIFAIGGTGARVLRSLTMLMACGINKFNDDICPIIIDYDINNGDKNRSINCMKKYSTIQNMIAKGRGKIDTQKIEEGKDRNKVLYPFFTTNIASVNGIPDWTWQFNLRKGEENLKYSDYIDYNNIHIVSPSTEDFVNCLYDTNRNSVYNELYLNMREGFQGNPNIGSVVFNDLKNCNEYKNFANSFNEGDRIVIVGSLFGGTGSSGIPKIVNAIKNDPNTIIKNANLSVVLVLPYFAVEIPKDKEISIKSNIFNSKTKAALNYYEDSGLNTKINSIYYVGDKIPTKVEPHIGNKEQKNKAHIVELICAMAIADFATSQPRPNNTKFKFSSENAITDGIGIDELIGSPNAWQQNDFVRGILHNMLNFVFSMRYFLDNIVNSPKRMDERQFYKELQLDFDNKTAKSSDGESPIKDYCAALYDFICKKGNLQNDDDGFWPWMKELHDATHGEHRLKIFNIDKENIVDILDGYDFRKDATKLGKLKIGSESPLMEYSDQFDTALNQYLYPYRNGQKQLKEQDKDSYPYIFNDILTQMMEFVRKFDSKLEEKFKLIP